MIELAADGFDPGGLRVGGDAIELVNGGFDSKSACEDLGKELGRFALYALGVSDVPGTDLHSVGRDLP